MLILKGESRKSVVCNAILHGNKHAICYQYTKDIVTMLNSYIVSLDNPQELLGKQILHEVEINNPDMLIVYTNEKQETLSELQKWINEIEKSYKCTVILTCR